MISPTSPRKVQLGVGRKGSPSQALEIKPEEGRNHAAARIQVRAAWNLQPGGLGWEWGEGQGFRHGRDKVGFPGIGFPRESTSSAQVTR